MLEEYDNGLKEFFLLEFTKCLVENSININDVVKLDDEKKAKKATTQGVKDIPKKTIKSIMSDLSREKKKINRESILVRKNHVAKILTNQVKKITKKIPMKKSFLKKMPSRNISRRPITRNRLLIDEPKFPKRLRYIRPVPTSQNVDLGKLNPLFSSLGIKQIDCNGAGTEIIVRTNHAKKTNMILNESEINSVIHNFSLLARIPVEDGVFRAAVGKVEIVAMISKTVGSKFIIRKIRNR